MKRNLLQSYLNKEHLTVFDECTLMYDTYKFNLCKAYLMMIFVLNNLTDSFMLHFNSILTAT